MSQVQPPRVLVVIPCLNEEATLERVVAAAVLTNDMAMQIIIVDGGSQDHTLQIAQNLTSSFPNVLLAHNPKRVQSAAINLAVRNFGATSDYLIRLDAHADYPSDYCKILVREAERTDAASVVVSMRTVGRGWFQRAVAVAQNSRLGTGGSPHRSSVLQGRWTDHGHHALMRVEAFKKVGGYDELFSRNEDAELDLRLQRAGFRIWLTGETSITHYPRSTPRALFRQYLGNGAGRAQTMIKHRGRPQLRQSAPIALLPIALVALLSPFSPIAALPLIVWAVCCISYGAVLGIVSNDSAAVGAGPAAMIMHLGWSLGFWTQIAKTTCRR
jgi:succinoglycan biosynthesis protein ExoA